MSYHVSECQTITYAKIIVCLFQLTGLAAGSAQFLEYKDLIMLMQTSLRFAINILLLLLVTFSNRDIIKERRL